MKASCLHKTKSIPKTYVKKLLWTLKCCDYKAKVYSFIAIATKSENSAYELLILNFLKFYLYFSEIFIWFYICKNFQEVYKLPQFKMWKMRSHQDKSYHQSQNFDKIRPANWTIERNVKCYLWHDVFVWSPHHSETFFWSRLPMFILQQTILIAKKFWLSQKRNKQHQIISIRLSENNTLYTYSP